MNSIGRILRVATSTSCGISQRVVLNSSVRYFGTSNHSSSSNSGQELTPEEKKQLIITQEDIDNANEKIEMEDKFRQDAALYTEELDGASLQGRSVIDVVRDRITGDVTRAPGYHLDNIKYNVNLEKPEFEFESEEEMLKHTDKYGLFDKHDDHHDKHHDDHHGAKTGDHHDDHHHKEDHHDDHHDHHEFQEETYKRGFFLNRDGTKVGVDFDTPFYLMFAAIPIYYFYSLTSEKYKPHGNRDFATNKEIYLNQVNPELRKYSTKNFPLSS